MREELLAPAGFFSNGDSFGPGFVPLDRHPLIGVLEVGILTRRSPRSRAASPSSPRAAERVDDHRSWTRGERLRSAEKSRDTQGA